MLEFTVQQDTFLTASSALLAGMWIGVFIITMHQFYLQRESRRNADL